MYVDYLELIVGLTILWLGTDLAISGATSVARNLKLSEFIIGIAVLSVGSDLPELTIAIDAGIRNLDGENMSGVVIGSAIGSSLGQIGLVLGIVGLIGVLTVPRQVVLQHGGVMLGSVLVLAMLGYDGTISRAEGVALLVIYAIYFILLLTDRQSYESVEDGQNVMPMVKAVPMVIIGMAAVVFGAELTVKSVVSLANMLQIDQTVIAVVIVGIGTSLPELSISVSAMLKKRSKLSAGNLIGSNIFDTLVPIGAAALISGLDFAPGMLRFDLPFLFVISAVALCAFVRARGLQKTQALLLLGLYITYVTLTLARA